MKTPVAVIILIISLSSCKYGSTTERSENGSKPNIILILADDLGYGELGCYGQTKIRTANIDQLARDGMRFTNFYAGNTVCAPSRSCLMLGLHPGHVRNRGNWGFNEEGEKIRVGLKDSDITIAEVLKNEGYNTAMYGKWHLEEPVTPSTWPGNQGFDYYLGAKILSQEEKDRNREAYRKAGYRATSFYPDSLYENGKKVAVQNNLFGERGEYLDDLYIRKAIEFIDTLKEAPFFIYLSLKTPHEPIDIDDDTSYFDAGWPEVERKYAAMISRMDRGVGNLIDFLETKKMMENTVVIFTSDNGPHNEGGHDHEFFNSNGNFRGYKRDYYDGGIRVPMIVRWNNEVPRGSVSNHLGAFWDFMPTLAELAGVPKPGHSDGLSLVPIIKGKQGSEHKYLYWEFNEHGGKQAIISGDWKLIRLDLMKEPYFELFNLQDDPGELKNVAELYPEEVTILKKLMDEAHSPSMEFPLPIDP